MTQKVKPMLGMGKWQYTKHEIKKYRQLYWMMAPFMLFFLAFTVLPVLIAVYYSLMEYNVLQSPKFVWFDNYTTLLLDDAIFLTAVKNTFILALIIGPFGYAFSFLMAWLINELPRVLRTILTVVFYAPSISGNAYVVFTQLFSGDPYGFINSHLMDMGLISEPILWLKDSGYMMGVVILVSLWMSLGVGFLSFIAGLQGVDRAQYEAGEIDGIRNRWQELWYITLPNMKPQLMFGAVMSITSSLSVADVTVALCGFPSTNYAAHTIINHLNDYGIIRLEMGYACSIAVLLFFLMLWLNLVIQKWIRKVGT
ncbi:MAG: sugar ABC transporter permease [Clostridia bacterium]|nr:sugar ABC transporter permease [Clostridia bacterium]MBQ9409582.1 sugar ABC transporter permease [Clostridia bacterium]